MAALPRSMNRLSWVGVSVAIVGMILAALTFLSGKSPHRASRVRVLGSVGLETWTTRLA
jgi:hypothetical protein